MLSMKLWQVTLLPTLKLRPFEKIVEQMKTVGGMFATQKCSERGAFGLRRRNWGMVVESFARLYYNRYMFDKK